MSLGKAKRTGQRRAFTLVELMIVVGIILILASLGTAQYLKYRENAQRAKCVANLRAILMAKLAWRANNPAALKIASELATLASDGYFRGMKDKQPTCPAGGMYNIHYSQEYVDMPQIPPTCDYNGGNDHVLKMRRAD